MKRFTKIITALILVCAIFSFVGCGLPVSGYTAVGLVKSHTSKNAYLSFYAFNGSMVITLNCEEGDTIECTAELEKGNAKIYSKDDGAKTELFSLSAGDNINRMFDGMKKGKVYIVIEGEDCQNGKFTFSVK